MHPDKNYGLLFLEETIREIKDNGKDETDILSVSNGEGWITWDQFKEIANFCYDRGFGGHYISLKLIVKGSDWWLERHEYDGSEWWEFKTLPSEVLPHVTKPTINFILDEHSAHK